MNIAYCKQCQSDPDSTPTVYTDTTPGDPFDDLHDHITSEHQDKFTDLLEQHFIGREQEMPPQLLQTMAEKA